MIRLLLLNWRDIKNPKKGGAEVFDFEVMKRLIQKGYEITWLSASFPGSASEEVIEGIKILRLGNQYNIHKQAYEYLKTHTFDYILDEYHGYPFMVGLYSKIPSSILIYEVAGKIWFQMWPKLIAIWGYIMEKFILFILKNKKFITISNSTRDNLIESGVKSNINLFLPGTKLIKKDFKKKNNQYFFVGRICKMKGINDLITAFSYLDDKNSKLYLIGKMDPTYQNEFDQLIKRLNLQNVILTGYIEEEEKNSIIASSLYLLSCSMKEGWGLVVTEANMLGTPSITYNVNGFKDSIKDNITGFLSPSNPIDFSNLINKSKKLVNYKDMQNEAYNYAQTFDWSVTTNHFDKHIRENMTPNKINIFGKLMVKGLFTSTSIVGSFKSKLSN